MKKVIFVVVAILAILGWNSVKADELKDLLGQKVVEYQGVCRINAQGMLVFTDKETKSVVECIVGADVGEKDLKSVLIFDEKGPVKLLEYSLKGRKQRTVWSRGSV